MLVLGCVHLFNWGQQTSFFDILLKLRQGFRGNVTRYTTEVCDITNPCGLKKFHIRGTGQNV